MVAPDGDESVDLRRREVEAIEKTAVASLRGAEGALHSARHQNIATKISIGVALVALVGLFFTQQQIQLTRDGIDHQMLLDDRRALDDRLAVGISALGDETATGRIAGITLLQRNALARVAMAGADSSPGARDDAVTTYSVVLDIMENYLRDPRFSGADGSSGIGWGQPVLPPEQGYVTGRLKSMLDELPAVNRLLSTPEQGPAIDLSGAQLYRVSWSTVDFHLLRGRELSGADMRGALLVEADFADANLRGTHLQCANFSDGPVRHANLAKADLRGADLRGANLAYVNLAGARLGGADLSQANVYGADFTGAGVEGMVTTGAFGTGQTVGQTFGPGAVGDFQLPGCLAKREYDAPH
jgi:uncharacterized protein YjbI with pentapeptide repeats